MRKNKQPVAQVEAGRTKLSSTRTRFWGRRCNLSIVKALTFEGCCLDLKGYMFDRSGSQNADRFTENLREVIAYVNREFTQGSNIQRSLEGNRIITPPIPTKPV